MKKGLCVLAVLLAMVLTAPAAEACSASNAIQKGDYIYDNDIDVYEIIEEVVLTEIQPDEEWTNPLAIHAAIGTIVIEFYAIGSVFDTTQIDNDTYITWMLDQDSAYELRYDRPQHQWNGTDQNHWDHNVHTVRDHARHHGDEWENGWDTLMDEPLPGGGPQGPPPVTSDHAG
jgi:hypothetical protein